MNANRKAIAFMSMQQNGMRISVSHVSNGTWEREIMNKENKIGARILKRIILLARAKGLSKRKILWKHCLRNVMPTIVSIMAVSVPHVTGGTVTVEAVFNYAGIGNLAVESAKYHDYNLLMVDVLITGFIVFLSSFIAQTVNEEIDPRMKDSEVRVW